MKTCSVLPISNLTPFTMLDYPDNIACVVWFSGCNMRCHYCHNPQLVKGKGKHSVEEIMEFLNRRIGKLDGVVLSGGEVTLYPDIINFIREIKEKGFKVKIDTNGTRPNIIKELLDKKLIDYVALDYKAPSYKFTDVCVLKERDYNNFKQTLDMLINQNTVKFEVRTTVHTSLLQEDDITTIIEDLENSGYKGNYYVQNFVNHDEGQLLGNLKEQEKLLEINKIISTENVKVEFRNFPEKGAGSLK